MPIPSFLLSPELDMLSYLTVDKPNTFPQHSCSNWSVWVVTPPTVSLCLTRSGIFSLLRCLPGVPVWLQSSRLSLLSWAKGLLWGNGMWRTVHACPCTYFPFQAAHSLRQFSPLNISPASPSIFLSLEEEKQTCDTHKEGVNKNHRRISTVHPPLPSKSSEKEHHLLLIS